MECNKRIIKLEKKIAVLEYQVQEQQKNAKTIKNGLDTIEKMLTQIKENPFGVDL